MLPIAIVYLLLVSVGGSGKVALPVLSVVGEVPIEW